MLWPAIVKSIRMLKRLAIGVFGLILILASGTLVRGVESKIEANPGSNEAVPTLDKAIADFAKSSRFQLSMTVGFPRHELIAELKRHDLKLIVTNRFPDRREVRLFVYRAPDSQIEITEMETLLSELKCHLHCWITSRSACNTSPLALVGRVRCRHFAGAGCNGGTRPDLTS